MDTISVLAIGGIGLMALSSLGGTGTPAWHKDPNQRLEAYHGQSTANINLANVVSSWKPIHNPSKFRATHTLSKKVRARMMTISDDPAVRRRGVREVGMYNYRVHGGVGPHPRLYSKWA